MSTQDSRTGADAAPDELRQIADEGKGRGPLMALVGMAWP
jgi:hypothetical protein